GRARNCEAALPCAPAVTLRDCRTITFTIRNVSAIPCEGGASSSIRDSDDVAEGSIASSARRLSSRQSRRHWDPAGPECAVLVWSWAHRPCSPLSRNLPTAHLHSY